MTPNSPEPDTNWRDDKNQTKSMKPVVNGIKPPKSKEEKEGLVSWIKSIAGIDSEDKPKAKPKTKRTTKKKKKTFKFFKAKAESQKNFTKEMLTTIQKNIPQRKRVMNQKLLITITRLRIRRKYQLQI